MAKRPWSASAYAGIWYAFLALPFLDRIGHSTHGLFSDEEKVHELRLCVPHSGVSILSPEGGLISQRNNFNSSCNRVVFAGPQREASSSFNRASFLSPTMINCTSKLRLAALTHCHCQTRNARRIRFPKNCILQQPLLDQTHEHGPLLFPSSSLRVQEVFQAMHHSLSHRHWISQKMKLPWAFIWCCFAFPT